MRFLTMTLLLSLNFSIAHADCKDLFAFENIKSVDYDLFDASGLYHMTYSLPDLQHLDCTKLKAGPNQRFLIFDLRENPIQVAIYFNGKILDHDFVTEMHVYSDDKDRDFRAEFSPMSRNDNVGISYLTIIKASTLVTDVSGWYRNVSVRLRN